MHCSPVQPSAAPSPHGSPCGSLQVWGAPTPQIGPSRASVSPVRGTDGQAAIPCGYGYGRHRAHDNTGSTSTAASPPCIKRAEEGAAPSCPITLRPPSCTCCPSPRPPQGRGARSSLCPLQCGHKRSQPALPTPSIRLPPQHSTRHPCQHPSNTAQLLEVTGTARSRAEPCSTRDMSPPQHLYPDHGTSQSWKPHAKWS